MKMRVEVAWPRPADLTADQLEELGRDLPGFASVIDDGQILVYARFDVEGDLFEVLEQTRILVAQAHARAFGYPADPVQVAVAPADQGLIPGPLDLVGTTDLAGMLGVSRQRAAQLAPRLGAPIGHPSGAPVWVRRSVELVTARWDRRPGRRTSVE